MLSLPSRLWVWRGAADLRKSFDGLSALARAQMGKDPLSGEGFIFFNRRRTLVKILYFERGGYWVCAKRLERGRFQAVEREELRAAELSMILAGLEFSPPRERRWWAPAAAT